MTNPAAALLSRFATSRPVCSVEPPGLGKSPLRLDKCSHLISRAACGEAKTSAAKTYDKSAAVSPPFFIRSDQIFTIASLPMAVQPFSALRVSEKSLREIVYGYISSPRIPGTRPAKRISRRDHASLEQPQTRSSSVWIPALSKCADLCLPIHKRVVST